MGLSRRIICKILIEDGVAVKYRNFTSGRRVAGDPVSVIRTMEDQKLDEFMICDVGTIDPALVRKMAAKVFTPISVAGSIKSMDLVDELFRESGIDRVVVKNPDLADDVARKYGAQAVIFPFSYRGAASFSDVPEAAGELLLTSIDRDGTGEGLDIGALNYNWTIPITLAGGCGKLIHAKHAFAAGANAIAISTMFFFTDKSPIKLRSWLHSEGADVRAP